MKPLLPKLTQCLKEFSQHVSQIPVPEFANVADADGTNQITHAWFWPCLGRWFKCGDVILTETGMSMSLFRLFVCELYLHHRHCELWHT